MSPREGRGPVGISPSDAEEPVDDQRGDHHRHEHQRDDPQREALVP